MPAEIDLLANPSTTTTIGRCCHTCGTPVGRRQFFCRPCRKQRNKAVSERFRAGINLAPGEVSTSRKWAEVGLSEVAKQFGVTRSRVQQIERVALLKVRRALMPFLREHRPEMADRVDSRTTPSQRLIARGPSRRPLSAKHTLLIRQMEELAEDYEKSGQQDVADEIRSEVHDLKLRLEQVLRRASIDT